MLMNLKREITNKKFRNCSIPPNFTREKGLENKANVTQIQFQSFIQPPLFAMYFEIMQYRGQTDNIEISVNTKNT